jgi:hypothetical protein
MKLPHSNDTLKYLLIGFRSFNTRLPSGRASDAERAHYEINQRFLFSFAQAICYQIDPDLQLELDHVRTEIVDYLHQAEVYEAQKTFIAPRLRRHGGRWEDIEITPEISADPDLTARVVPAALASRLRQLHKQQVMTVLRTVKESL